MKNQNYAGIDLLRFAAALAVGFYHLAFMSWAMPGSAVGKMSGLETGFPEIQSLASVGWIGVQVFFVISGFVIMFSAKVPAWNFLRSRILRLYPAVWICAPLTLILALCLGAYGAMEAPTRIVRSLVLFPKGNWVDGVYWTLGIEMSFYALVFLLLLSRQRRLLPAALVVLGGISSIYWLARLVLSLTGAAEPELFLITASGVRLFELSLIPHGCYFAIGGLVWAIMGEGRSPWLWLSVGLSVLGALAEIHFTAGIKSAEAGGYYVSGLAQGVWLLCMAFMVLSIARPAVTAHVVSTHVARKIGQMTYPFYLLHTMLGSAVFCAAHAAGVNTWLALTAALLLGLFGSHWVAQKLEPRAKALLVRVLDSGTGWLQQPLFTNVKKAN
jgi:peptidoglycan/LPS O-acetylase OafA/YrhL